MLFGDPSFPAQLRYFEVAPGGWTTLERHEHVHAVMVIRGKGQCLATGVAHLTSHCLKAVHTTGGEDDGRATSRKAQRCCPPDA